MKLYYIALLFSLLSFANVEANSVFNYLVKVRLEEKETDIKLSSVDEYILNDDFNSELDRINKEIKRGLYGNIESLRDKVGKEFVLYKISKNKGDYIEGISPLIEGKFEILSQKGKLKVQYELVFKESKIFSVKKVVIDITKEGEKGKR